MEEEVVCGKCGLLNSLYGYDLVYKRYVICWNCGCLHELGTYQASLAKQFATTLETRGKKKRA